MTTRYTILDEGMAIRCHACNQVSHDINDVRQLYCGQCQRFHEGNNDPTMPAELRLIADGMAMEARATIAQGREVQPQIIVLRVADKAFWEADMNMGTPAERDAMAQEVRQMADEHNADAVILLSEAWTLAGTGARRASLREQYGGNLANVPGRQEVLLLTVESGGHHWQGMALISGSGLARRCGEVRYKWMDAEKSSGRFTHFLTTDAEKAQMASVLAKIGAAWRANGIDPEATVEHEEGRRLIEAARRMMVRHRHFDMDEARLAEAAALLATVLRTYFA
jgi:hypothetical protein